MKTNQLWLNENKGDPPNFKGDPQLKTSLLQQQNKLNSQLNSTFLNS